MVFCFVMQPLGMQQLGYVFGQLIKHRINLFLLALPAGFWLAKIDLKVAVVPEPGPCDGYLSSFIL
jgi:hypothetical protein